MYDDELNTLDRASRARMAAQERVLDRLAAAMFDLYEILGYLNEADAENLRWLAPSVLDLNQSVAQLMKRLDDRSVTQA